MDRAEVEAVAEALLNESRRSMFAIPIPLDRASGPGRKQYEREAEVAIAALDAVRVASEDRNMGRLAKLADWIERDRREPDKVLLYSQEIRYLSRCPSRRPVMDRAEVEAVALREKIADELAHNDECGSGPLSRQEYLDDADALLGLIQAGLAREGWMPPGARSPQGEDHEAGIEAAKETDAARSIPDGEQGPWPGTPLFDAEVDEGVREIVAAYVAGRGPDKETN